MTEEERTAMAETEERPSPCFVRHKSAGGQCPEPGTRRFYGLSFCERHGLEVELGAGLQAYEDAYHFFEMFRNPHHPRQGDAIERTLEFAITRLREESPTDRGYQQALMDAYPVISDNARNEFLEWHFGQAANQMPALDILLQELHVMQKLLGIAYGEGLDWLVETMEEERQHIAAQAAYALRTPELPEPHED